MQHSLRGALARTAAALHSKQARQQLSGLIPLPPGRLSLAVNQACKT